MKTHTSLFYGKANKVIRLGELGALFLLLRLSREIRFALSEEAKTLIEIGG